MKWLLVAILAGGLAFAEQDTTTLMQEAALAFKNDDLESAKSLFQLVLVSDPKNQGAQNFLRQIAAREARSAAMVRALDRTVIPRLELTDASAKEAFDYTLGLTEKHAASGVRPNVVWMVPENHSAKVNLSLVNIPASTALRYVAESAGLRLTFDAHAIKVRAHEAPLAND